VRRSVYHSFDSLVNVLPAISLTESFLSFSYRRLTHCTSHCITFFVFLPMTCSPCCSLHRSLLSPADATPATLLAVTFVTLCCRCLIHRTAHCITCFVHLPSSCSPRRSMYRSFLSPADPTSTVLFAASPFWFSCCVFPATPFAVSLVYFNCGHLAC
jgi:hypothetical protein